MLNLSDNENNEEIKEKLAAWRKHKKAELQDKKMKVQVPNGIKELILDKMELQYKKNQLRRIPKRKKRCKDKDLNDFT